VSDVQRALLTELLGADGRLFVVSNRGPVTFEDDPAAKGGMTAARGSGGLVTALGDLGRHAPVTWVACALTDADRRVAGILRELGESGGRDDVREANGVHPHGVELADPRQGTDQPGDRNGTDAGSSTSGLKQRVRELLAATVPGQDLRLRYEDMPSTLYEGYYEVVANPFLWFLQHQMYALPYEPNVDRRLMNAWRTGYRPANRLLADAAVEAAQGVERPVFLLQDYHLYLAAERIRERRPDAAILHFTHIPWPPAGIWQAIPQSMRRAICEGLLGADIVGLQTDRYASHFLDTVASFVRDARVDRDGRMIKWRGRRIRVRSYPISVDPEGLGEFAASPAVEERVARIRTRIRRSENPTLIVRADRIEPSKNVLRGFLAFEDLIARRPDLCANVRFLAVQAQTRSALPEYGRYAAAVREVVARINGMREPDDQPVWIYDGSDYAMAIAALRLADVVLVNPVIDGMNLVAKEAVLVGERDPVLVLSETAGAAEQLAQDALIVAPADVIGTSEQLERALAMPLDERHGRLRRLRASVRDEDIAWWLSRQLRDLAAIVRGEQPPSRRLRDSVRRVEAAVIE
jgi:trehalose 6-phosphate synthase